MNRERLKRAAERAEGIADCITGYSYYSSQDEAEILKCARFLDAASKIRRYLKENPK